MEQREIPNEILAQRIKNGETYLQEKLWLQIKKLVVKKAQSYVLNNKSACLQAGVEADDLIQAGYFAMLDAIKAYPGEGAPYRFLTYLNFPLKNQFNALTGVRDNAAKSKKARQAIDQIAGANSFDAEISPSNGGTGETTLSNYIPDPEAEAAFARIEENDYLEKLGLDLQEALQTLPPKQAHCVRMRYLNDETQSYIAKTLGVSQAYVMSLIKSGLLSLRRCNALQEYRQEQYARAYHKSSTKTCRNYGSIVEQIVVHLDERERELQAFLDDMSSTYDPNGQLVAGQER